MSIPIVANYLESSNIYLTISIDFSNYNPNSQNPRMPASGEESAGGARRRMNNPGFIFSAYIMNPDANGPARAFSFSRHARGASPEDVCCSSSGMHN